VLDLHHPGWHDSRSRPATVRPAGRALRRNDVLPAAAGGHPAGGRKAIGCHGQTLRHQPAEGLSLYLNQLARLAELTGITVLANFQSRDIAAGGQGGPIAAAFLAANLCSAEHHQGASQDRRYRQHH